MTTAVDAFLSAAQDQAAAHVYGQSGGGSNNLLNMVKRDNLAAEGNPKGSGVVVSLVYAGGGAFASATAHRAGWLVLNGTIYPIDVDAAQAFGMLWDGYPDGVKLSAGLGSSDYFGMSAYGIEDFVAYNADTVAEYDPFLNATNGLCAKPTAWG